MEDSRCGGRASGAVRSQAEPGSEMMKFERSRARAQSLLGSDVARCVVAASVHWHVSRLVHRESAEAKQSGNVDVASSEGAEAVGGIDRIAN